jgi:hypothetical protein
MSVPVQLPDTVRATDGSESHTFKLCPRYNTPWEPGIESKRDFNKAEDGQATIVSCHIFFELTRSIGSIRLEL